MQEIRIRLSNPTRKNLVERMKKANGNIQMINRILIVLAAADGFSFDAIAGILRVSAEAVRLNFKKFVLNGLKGLKTKKRPGRPSKLTKSQKRRLKKMIADGPEKAGYPGACREAR